MWCSLSAMHDGTGASSCMSYHIIVSQRSTILVHYTIAAAAYPSVNCTTVCVNQEISNERTRRGALAQRFAF